MFVEDFNLGFNIGAHPLFQLNQDVDKDGTIDIALQCTCGYPPGALPEEVGDFEFELSEATTPGGTYTVRETKTSPTGRVAFKANSTKYYKMRVRAIAWQGGKGEWSVLSAPIQPSGAIGAPASPTGISLIDVPLGYSVSWTAPTELDYDHTEVCMGTSSTPFTGNAASSNSRSITLLQATTIPLYPWVRHVNTSGLASAWTRGPSALESLKLSSSEIAAGAVTAQDEEYTAAAYGSFGTGGQNIQQTTASHGEDARFVVVTGSFRNTSGAARQFDVELWAGGTQFAIMPAYQVQDNGYCTITAIFPNPTGSSTTFSLRVQTASTGNNVANRRLSCASFKR